MRKILPATDKTIFAFGGGFNKVFLRYIAQLTGKSHPKICFVPTATGDNPNTILNWYAICENEAIRPFVLRTYISSYNTKESFEDQLLSMDAIIVGGGNTLNMMGIWKYQGIDVVMKKAYDKGIVLAGGSAGSLCWFKEGSTDSRPGKLTIVQCLGFLPFSHSPHYHSEPGRRPMYFEAIRQKELMPGYACDDMAGLVFVNGKLAKSVSQQENSHSYFVSLVDGHIKEELLPAEIIT
ncbi:MAG TPA: peptidase E [Flavihumibacter sp.]|nr:peptidase E [Flavihumibacter sp.]